MHCSFSPNRVSACLSGGACCLLVWLIAGCIGLRHVNTVPYVEEHVRAADETVSLLVLKTIIFYPARDVLTLDWLGRLLRGDEAWNAAGCGVADSSFYTNRDPADLTPRAMARGPCTMPPPQPPLSVVELSPSGRTPGFVATDALGRTFRFKVDHPDYPELGSSAAVIGSRICWALGYNVPPVFLVRIDGTGDPRFDGRRAVATLYLDGVIGHFKFDWFRYRREVRGLRMASAWINDTDRVGTNTLVVQENGRARYVLIDFNSCLGSWNGRPKEPWRGHRHVWSLGEFLVGLVTLGLVHAPYDPNQPVVSPAVGRFDARFELLAWRSQLPNTAFDHMTVADLRWIAGKIAGLRGEHLEAIVAEARLTDPADARYLVETLLKRRAAILAVAGVSTPEADR
ncbi:MAG: hypothetical protein ACYSUI_08370 [Planctomycetota bacterium]